MATQIETEWAAELASHFGRHVDEVLQPVRPWFEYPPGQLRIELMDGSTVQFAHAFHLVNEAKRAIAVFTEHCGHHLYPSHDARIFRDAVLIHEQKT